MTEIVAPAPAGLVGSADISADISSADIAVRELTARDEPAVLSLLGASLAGGPTGERTADFFRWKHAANPFGRSPGLVAEANGRLVGLRVFLRWEFCAGGQPVPAVRAVDTATHPDYQGRGIFRRLTTELLDRLGRDPGGPLLVFNTPNGNSLPGYRKMGWAPVGNVPIAIRPVRLGRFLRGFRSASARRPPAAPVAAGPVACPLPPAAAVFADPTARAALADLVAEAAAAEDAADRDQRLRTRRSVDYLQWRYADAPGLDYRVLTLERAGGLAGVALGRPRRRGGLTELTLAEVIVRPGDRASARRLLQAAAARARCDHVATHLPAGTELGRAGRLAGYLHAPGAGMTLVTRPFPGYSPALPDPRTLSSWRFSLGDLEVF
jgi:GNAT superfamily N-acetyltransferase